MIFRIFLQILLIFLMISSIDASSAKEIPDGVSVITAPEVRQLMSAEKPLLVHTLSRIEFQMQHIPGSINIPVDEVTDSPLLPKEKNAKIIFYCNGQACPYSKRASVTAVKRGYKDVAWFRGGILEWRKFQYEMFVDQQLRAIDVTKLSPKDFKKKSQGDVVVLDVRPQWWRQSKEKAGVIVGTNKMIPLLKLDKRLIELPKDKPILIVDRLMRQSIHAAKYLSQNGFNVVGVLKGGSKRWGKEGLPYLAKNEEPVLVGGL